MSASCPRSLALLAGLLVPSSALADDPFSLVGEAGDYVLLGMADAYTGTSSGFVQLGSEARVFGHVGARWRLETAGGGVIEGDAHHGDGGSLHAGTVGGLDAELDAADWAAIQADAHAAVAAAEALDAKALSGASAESCQGAVTASGSLGSRTLAADPDAEGLTVYAVDGCLFLGDGDTWTIEGTPEDRFVIRVTGGLRLDGGATIALDGIPGSAVMFVFSAGGWADEPFAQVTTWDGAVEEGAELSGVFLAPWMYWQLGDGTWMPDTRILAGGVQANIQDMNGTGPIEGVPEDTDPGDDSDPSDDEDPDGGDGDGDSDTIWGWDGCGPIGSTLYGVEGIATEDGGTGSSSDSDVGGSSAHGDVSGTPSGSSPGGSCSVGALPASGLLALAGLIAVGRRREA